MIADICDFVLLDGTIKLKIYLIISEIFNPN